MFKQGQIHEVHVDGRLTKRTIYTNAIPISRKIFMVEVLFVVAN